MNDVILSGALPNAWTRVDLLSNILAIRADEQASIRLHFGNDTTPAQDAAYVVVQNHLPRPIIEPYRHDPVVWIMSDGAEIIEVKVAKADVVTNTVTIMPTHGPLPAGVVGSGYVASVNLDIKLVDDTVGYADKFQMEITSGELPPGLTLGQHSTNKAQFIIEGTPATAGEYFFTLSVRFDPYWAEAYGVTKGEFARGIYSIKIEAAA